MHRRTENNADFPGHDSFLDIVANMVGILIILVMVVGVRVKNAPVTAAIADGNQQARAKLEKDLAIEESLRSDVLKVADEIGDLQKETLLQGRRRDVLATMVSAWEHELRAGRDQMDAETRRAFDLRRSLSESRAHLDELVDQRLQAETVRAEPILIESYPTPLSRTVNGREAHVQLRGGRIAWIPLEQLVDRLKEDAQRQKYKLLDLPEMTDTVGPLDGFRLRYTLERHDVSPEMAMISGRRGSYARLKRWTLIPVSGQMGEPVETALAEGSEFRQVLSRLHPGRTAITIWTYADSFASFRLLKKALYQQGYAVAARPLPLGTPISGSPEGSRSAAE